MRKILLRHYRWLGVAGGMVGLLAALMTPLQALALNPIPTPDPKPGSYGLEAVKKQPAPTVGATITTPGSGSGFTSSPISVNGTCPTGLLVQIFNNGVMVGAVMCEGGSFSIQVSLFSGQNELTAMVYDDIGQSGPVSNTVTVTYTDLHLSAFGQLVTLTSSYGRRSAAVSSQLDWPLQLSGGTGPYAFSIDWGDGSAPELKSQALAGVVMISHTYKKAGIYLVNVKVTDANGVSAFLQLVAVSSGQVDGAVSSATGKPKKAAASAPQILWFPTIVLLILLLPTYWLGRRSMLVSIRNKMLKERDSYQEEIDGPSSS